MYNYNKKKTMSYVKLMNALKESQQCLDKNCPKENAAYKEYSMELAKKQLVKIIRDYKSGKIEKAVFDKKMNEVQNMADKNAKVIKFRSCAVKHCESATKSMGLAILAIGKEKLQNASPAEKKELQAGMKDLESTLKQKPLDMKKLSLALRQFV